MFTPKTKLEITSTDDHFFVDGPRTRTAFILNELLYKRVDLDELPAGEYEYRFTNAFLGTELIKVS
jgi:hypothetical protein